MKGMIKRFLIIMGGVSGGVILSAAGLFPVGLLIFALSVTAAFLVGPSKKS